MVNLRKLTISEDGQYHTLPDGTEAYSARFDEVLSYHLVENEYQIAPVIKGNNAFHIGSDGKAIYKSTFNRTFGFYCDLAAVVDGYHWFHITPEGKAAYSERYDFVGNFQQDIAVVCNKEGFYYHIDKSGKPIYKHKWHYCGDFREGIAVVQHSNGLSTHININGDFIHSQWFLDLDVYHKGFARAKNRAGWQHINKDGKPIYQQYYASIEPFYNGFARVETFDGSLQIIDESGALQRELRSSQSNDFASLSADMVGYWRTFTIAAAAELKIFDYLPARTQSLSQKTKTIEARLYRLLSALGELGLVDLKAEMWELTPKAQYLTSEHPKSLRTAATEYRDELLERWYDLVTLMKQDVKASDIFQKVANNEEHTKKHHKMLRSYALEDYQKLVSNLDIECNDTVFDAAGGDGTLALLIQNQFPKSNVILGDLAPVVKSSEFTNKTSFDLFNNWSLKADKILLARVLHDWNDDDAVKILSNACDSLHSNGVIYIFEMIREENDFSGSLCDLHLLTVTGGEERTRAQFEALFDKVDLYIDAEINQASLITIMKLKRKII
ncbi:methyltransferase [Alteromonas sp. a30]|uniref:methyltransferase n=1 Tax=Alteromonas sp. a30 TaxID=2730917 RepID=UPI00227E46D8|nr:methyltransferase [Alteromonas sp. a30]MCY7296867.1 methyltransferase [Alteromonas sp. a30]